MPGIVAVILLLIVVGVMLPFIPLDAGIRRIIVAIVAIVALLWLIAVLFGVPHPHVTVP